MLPFLWGVLFGCGNFALFILGGVYKSALVE